MVVWHVVYRFYSDTGFKLGCKIDNNIVETIDFSDKMLEVCTVDAKDFVSIKNNMNKNDALDYAIQLSKHGTENYLFFDGSWSVWTRGLGESKLSSSNLILVKGGSKGILLPSTTDKPIVLQNIQPEGVIAIEDRRYRGALEMMLTPEGCIQVINELGLEEYLYGVIPKEMPPNWHVQALKAQAVTARTYTLANLSKWRKQGFDIDSNTSDQVYYGFDAENPNTNIAVDETRGEIICFEGKPIEAFYHSDSGGLTEECKDVFVSDLPYLKSVEDIFYSNSPNSTWEVSLSIDEISNRVKSVANVGKVCDISIFERTPTVREKKLIVKCSEGEIILEKNQIRNVFGLKSTFSTF